MCALCSICPTYKNFSFISCFILSVSANNSGQARTLGPPHFRALEAFPNHLLSWGEKQHLKNIWSNVSVWRERALGNCCRKGILLVQGLFNHELNWEWARGTGNMYSEHSEYAFCKLSIVLFCSSLVDCGSGTHHAIVISHRSSLLVKHLTCHFSAIHAFTTSPQMLRQERIPSPTTP